jgi:hypothetical protein
MQSNADGTMGIASPAVENADLEVGGTPTSVQEDEKKDETLVDFGDETDKLNPLNVSCVVLSPVLKTPDLFSQVILILGHLLSGHRSTRPD